jgi:hypothetical protein
VRRRSSRIAHPLIPGDLRLPAGTAAKPIGSTATGRPGSAAGCGELDQLRDRYHQEKSEIVGSLTDVPPCPGEFATASPLQQHWTSEDVMAEAGRQCHQHQVQQPAEQVQDATGGQGRPSDS